LPRIATLAVPLCMAWVGAATAGGPGIDWALDADAVRSSCIVETARAHDRIESAVAAAGDTPPMQSLLAIETAVADMQDALIAQTVLATVGENEALRREAAECQSVINSLTVNIASHPGIFAIAVAAVDDATGPVDRRLARVYLESGRQAGAHLPGEVREQIAQRLAELGRVQLEFQGALARDRTTITISADEAASLPIGLQASFEPVGDEFRVPVTYGAVNREFIARMAAGDARRRYQVAFLNRGGGENLERVQQALALRHEIAELSGFPSWARYRLDTLMARTPERALALVGAVDDGLMDKARDEMATLTRLKADQGDDSPFAAWDYSYFQPLLERKQFGVDDAEIRRYFPVDRVIPGVLEIYETLFGIRIEREPSGDDAWAPGVALYSISEADGEGPFAWFYLDLEPREGKFLSPANFPMRAGRDLPGGGYRQPVSAIIGNGPRSNPGEPALFSHAGLVQFFHEFGHVMHTTLSTAPYASLYGANTRRDFVETPSQMLENWVWQPDVLARLSSHVETGEPLPAETVNRMAALKRASNGVFWTRQAFLATYDMTLHGENPDIDANEHWFTLMPRLTPLPPTPGTMPPASFMPIMGGYEANYYGYLWSKVYAQDLFSVFIEEGIDDPKVGMRFRKTVLEPGGTREPDELVREFLGRPVSFDAFYAELGVR
jgi:Zn-dependent oligopeptidase